MVMVADGGSVDDSREEAESVEKSPWTELLITIYRGVPGKGSAIRAIFEAAHILNAKVVVLFDADLRSINTHWIKQMVEPILRQRYDFVAPLYKRYKYDGTITNNIVYSLTRALYGYRIRQPIGGDFAFSNRLIKRYIDQDVWETDVGRFGVDIWLTTEAMVGGYNLCQANLGVKIHDEKDPAQSLGPMFQQVVNTLFSLMEENQDYWKNVKGSQPVPIVGPEINVEPKPFEISIERLITDFKVGFSHYDSFWEKVLSKDNFKVFKELINKNEKDFHFPTEVWVKSLYDIAATYHHWAADRKLLVQLMTPLYFARIASFVNETYDMNNDEAEKKVEEQAQLFEEMKPYLLKRWNSD
ncbi:MAG: glycosyltransferase [Calditrichaeota bacterium]|nr:MAG: glycosyltransferase [Calditrichota bacterium]